MGEKIVLWMSRHDPLPVQINYLKNKIGDFELVKYSKPLSTAEEAVKIIKQYNADYVIPVLPLSFIARLVEVSKREGFTILRAEMELVHNCETKPCSQFDEYTDTIVESKDLSTGETIYRHFRFKEFKILKDIVFVEEPF